jgi:hypothetical protein
MMDDRLERLAWALPYLGIGVVFAVITVFKVRREWMLDYPDEDLGATHFWFSMLILPCVWLPVVAWFALAPVGRWVAARFDDVVRATLPPTAAQSPPPPPAATRSER